MNHYIKRNVSQLKNNVSTYVYCVTIDVYGITTGYRFCYIISVKETDVEDDAGNIMKEVYVQPVEPLEFHAGYRLASEDPAIFLMEVKMTEMAECALGHGHKCPFQLASQPPAPVGHPLVLLQKPLVEAPTLS